MYGSIGDCHPIRQMKIQELSLKLLFEGRFRSRFGHTCSLNSFRAGHHILDCFATVIRMARWFQRFNTAHKRSRGAALVVLNGDGILLGGFQLSQSWHFTKCPSKIVKIGISA